MRIQMIMALAAAFAAGSAVQAAPLETSTLSINAPGINGNESQVVYLPFSGDLVHGSGEGPNYTWSISADADPLINWGFTAVTPGPYHVEFFLPLVPGTYELLRNQASVVLSDVGDGDNSSTVSALTVDGQVPDGVSISGALLTGGPITALNGGFANASFGPAWALQTLINPSGMRMILDFDFVSDDNDGSAAFAGQLVLTNLPPGGDLSDVPEPATTAMIGAGLLGIAAIKRLHRRR